MQQCVPSQEQFGSKEGSPAVRQHVGFPRVVGSMSTSRFPNLAASGLSKKGINFIRRRKCEK